MRDIRICEGHQWKWHLGFNNFEEDLLLWEAYDDLLVLVNEICPKLNDSDVVLWPYGFLNFSVKSCYKMLQQLAGEVRLYH